MLMTYWPVFPYTGTYKYIQLVIVHTHTYQYVPVQVHHCISRCMIVHSCVWWYIGVQKKCIQVHKHTQLFKGQLFKEGTWMYILFTYCLHTVMNWFVSCCTHPAGQGSLKAEYWLLPLSRHKTYKFKHNGIYFFWSFPATLPPPLLGGAGFSAGSSVGWTAACPALLLHALDPLPCLHPCNVTLM